MANFFVLASPRPFSIKSFATVATPALTASTNGLGSGLLSGSLNINKADTELQKKRSKIVAKNVEKSLMILFLKDYGWLQLTVCHFEFLFFSIFKDL